MAWKKFNKEENVKKFFWESSHQSLYQRGSDKQKGKWHQCIAIKLSVEKWLQNVIEPLKLVGDGTI